MLEIQNYNKIIEHVPGTLNIPADAFSPLVEKVETRIHHIIARQHSDNSLRNATGGYAHTQWRGSYVGDINTI